jgi:hypothetical protein
VATKAILNGMGDANDNLQDDATTDIFSDGIGNFDTKIDQWGDI